jgi:PKD repeat protein
VRGCGEAGSGSACGSRAGLLSAFILVIALSGTATATTIVVPTDDQLIDHSPAIVSGLVLDSRALLQDGAIYTDSRIRVKRVIRGDIRSELTVRELGGRIGNRATVAFGQPIYTPGERVLLFLRPIDGGRFETADLMVGRFVARQNVAGEEFWFRPAAMEGTRLINAGPESVQRAAGAFERYLERRATGARPRPDYFRADVRFAPDSLSKFGLLSDPQLHRWFAFDEGRTVSFKSYGAQRGYEGGGLSELQSAIASWSSFPEAKIRFTYDGPSDQVLGGLKQFDGVNAVLFNDELSEIEGSWNGQSGIVGRASYDVVRRNGSWTAPFAADAQHPAREYSEVWEIVEGNLVIQDGVSPVNRIPSLKLAQILAHEIGHTLGFAHSRDSESLMCSTIDGSGPHLRSDDQLAARWLYPVGISQDLAGEEVVADFALSSDSPAAGAEVALHDRSAGSPTSWSWSFGDSTTSSERSPRHVYSSPGLYEVTLTVSRGATSSSTTRKVQVNPEAPRLTKIVPVVASVSGAERTNWRTELVLFNEGEEIIEVSLSYLPSAGGTALRHDLQIRGGQTVAFSDVISDIFNLTSTAGALRVEARSGFDQLPRLHVASRTFTSCANGTYGQSVPAEEILAPVTHMTGIESSTAFRTNLGFANESVNAISAGVSLHGPDGVLLGTLTLELPGQSFQQTPLVRLFPVLAGADWSGLSLTVTADRGGALVSYASVIDNVTQDPVLIPARPAVSGTQLVAGLARTPGAVGTFWRTDLALFNPLETRMELSLAIQGSAWKRELLIEPMASVSIDDVMSWLGADVTAGTLIVDGSGEAAPVISARTYTTDSSGGTFGQWIPAVPVEELNERATLTGIRNNHAFRTNVGIVNPGSEPIEVTIALAGSGRETVMTIPPFGSVQSSATSLFENVSDEAKSISVSSSHSVYAFVSVVDNRSGDATFISSR